MKEYSSLSGQRQKVNGSRTTCNVTRPTTVSSKSIGSSLSIEVPTHFKKSLSNIILFNDKYRPAFVHLISNRSTFIPQLYFVAVFYPPLHKLQ